MSANLENSAVATGLEKVSFHSNPKERQCQRIFKLLHNCCHLICQQNNAQNSSSQASTVRKLLKNFQMFKLDLEKAAELEIKLPKSAGSLKKQKNSRQMSTSASVTMLKLQTVWITTNCGKFFRRWENQTIFPASCETCRQVKKQQLNQTWNNRLVSYWERSMSRLYIVMLLILIQLICREHHAKCQAG